MDVSGRILANLDAGYPCRHDEDLYFRSVDERKIMNHFGVKDGATDVPILLGGTPGWNIL